MEVDLGRGHWLLQCCTVGSSDKMFGEWIQSSQLTTTKYCFATSSRKDMILQSTLTEHHLSV